MACQTYPPTSFQVCGAIRDKYNQMGGPTSFLLFPKSNELTNPGNTGKRSEFVGGNIYWSAATGAHPVAHEFLFKWGDHGYETGFLKYPTSDEIVLADGVSRRQKFQGGHIYWSALTGAHSIQGLIYDKWQNEGGETGHLGFPTSDEKKTPDGVGRFNTFQNGSIYWSPSTGAHAVFGLIEWFWALSGREAGVYGYPIEGPTYDNDNVSQKFQKGKILLWDGQLGGVHQVDDNEVDAPFLPEDTWLFPEYPQFPHPDGHWTEWNTVPDPDGELYANNRTAAEIIDDGMAVIGGLDTARYLWANLYDNPGSDVTLDTGTVDTFMDGYSSLDPAFPTPVEVRAKNRESTIAEAIKYADQLDKPFKASFMSLTDDNVKDWIIVAGPPMSDHYLSLGRHSMSAATSAIVEPGPPNEHPVRYAQQTHIYDVYDFDPDDIASGSPGGEAASVAWDGFKLGINKWFRVFGHGSQKTGVGLW